MFVQTDPIGIKGGLNTYLYAMAAPTKYTDPEGLAPFPLGPYDSSWGPIQYQPPQPRAPFPFSWPPPPPGPPGSGCGDEKWDCVVPDIYPQACKAHDQCYSTPGRTQAECDNQFWRDMFVESGPWPNVIGPTFYWMGVRFGGGNAYNRAQGRR